MIRTPRGESGTVTLATAIGFRMVRRLTVQRDSTTATFVVFHRGGRVVRRLTVGVIRRGLWFNAWTVGSGQSAGLSRRIRPHRVLDMGAGSSGTLSTRASDCLLG
jgi:hypothetical protein